MANGDGRMTQTQRVLAIFGAVILGIILIVAIVGTIRGTLPPSTALGVLSPSLAGVIAAIVVKAKSDNDRNGGPPK